MTLTIERLDADARAVVRDLDLGTQISWHRAEGDPLVVATYSTTLSAHSLEAPRVPLAAPPFRVAEDVERAWLFLWPPSDWGPAAYGLVWIS